MATDYTDYTGQRFGRLLVVKKEPGSRARWICQCDCGKQKTLYACFLKKTQSCGCLEEENRLSIGKRTQTHGKTNTILYSKYCSMKERIHNPNYKYYFRYGGRGIKICDEWENSFESFYEWAYKNGYDDSKKGYEQTLDRINVNGDYEPDNCRWVSQREQSNNRGCTRYIEYEGKDIPITEFCSQNGITYHHFVTRRLDENETAEQIIEDWNDLHSGKYMTTQETAEYYNVSVSTIRQWIKKGKIKAKKTRLLVLIPKER